MVYRVLLVCMGNICRSPTAEGVLKHRIKIMGLSDKVEVDSAGTHGYHVGEPPDPRTQRAALSRGYNLSQMRARRVAPQDLEYFDLVLAMDKTNLDNLRRMAPADKHDRIRLFMDYSENFDDDEVPDPFYGLGHGFDLVIDMVEDAAKGLADELKKKLS
ncbi:MAG: low molecular weight protein-tyrosine-phosphatase [Betaproteobacteria bacterium]